MSDITKCKGDGCKKKDMCYRYTAEADQYQAYFSVVPAGECEYYWEDIDARKNKNIQ